MHCLKYLWKGGQLLDGPPRRKGESRLRNNASSVQVPRSSSLRLSIDHFLAHLLSQTAWPHLNYLTCATWRPSFLRTVPTTSSCLVAITRRPSPWSQTWYYEIWLTTRGFSALRPEEAFFKRGAAAYDDDSSMAVAC